MRAGGQNKLVKCPNLLYLISFLNSQTGRIANNFWGGRGVSSGLANVPSFALFIFWSLPLIKRSYKIYNHANICINFDRTEMYVLLALYLVLLGFRTTLCYLLAICWTFGALHHCQSETADCSRAWFGMAHANVLPPSGRPGRLRVFSNGIDQVTLLFSNKNIWTEYIRHW